MINKTKMKDLILKLAEEGEWKPLRFTVYNYLEEKEFYQQRLEKLGYDSAYDDLECKSVCLENITSKQFKRYVENNLQDGNPIVTICVIDNLDYFTMVKPKNVDIISVLKID